MANTVSEGWIIGYDFEPREIRSFDVEAEAAPEVGQRVTRARPPDAPPGSYVTSYGAGPWEVIDVLPISTHPGWVRVYVVVADDVVLADNAPSVVWEDEDLTAGPE